MTRGQWNAIKATGENILEGWAVRYGGPNDADLDGEYFSEWTDFGPIGQTIPMLWHHGLDATIGNAPIGKGTIVRKPGGLWYRGVLALRSEYVRYIKLLAKKGLLGFSSGAQPASVRKSATGAITAWRIAEVSATFSPADYKNQVSLKALIHKAGMRNAGADQQRIDTLYGMAEDMCEILLELGATPIDEATEPPDIADTMPVKARRLALELDLLELEMSLC